MKDHWKSAALIGVLWLGSGASAEPNQIPLRDGATLTQLPHFGWSSFGVNLLLTEDRMVMCSDTPSNSLDLTTPDAIWTPFHGEDASLGLDERHYGMAVDPVNSDVFYYCGGNVFDKNMSYRVGFENGSLHRSLDSLTSSSRAFWSRPTDPADKTRMENYALGCAADLGSGLENDGFLASGDRFKLFAHGPRFAFDSTDTIAVRDDSWPPEQPSVTVSKRLYFMSYLHGLWEGSYGSDGLVRWSRIHGAPEYCETLNADCSCGSVDLDSADTKHFDFGYPAADECPEPTDGTSCSDIETGVELRLVERVVEVDDDPTVVRVCQEIEEHWVGTSVTVDPQNANVLYAGYAVTNKWPRGGLYRLVRQTDGSFIETRLPYVDPMTGDRDLDIRDIVIDPFRTVVTDSMGTVSQFIYVAAGSDGMFRAKVQSDGTVDLEAFNAGLYPRRQYLEDVAAGEDTPCCSAPDRCGEVVAIDQGRIGGQSYLVLIDGDNPGGAYYAPENFTDTVSWTRIYNLGAEGSYTHKYAQSIVVDDVNDRFIVGTGGAFLFDINVPADLPSASVDCGSLEVTTWTHLPNIGMATNAFQDVVYDPVLPDSRLHATTFDEGYIPSRGGGQRRRLRAHARRVRRCLCQRCLRQRPTVRTRRPRR